MTDQTDKRAAIYSGGAPAPQARTGIIDGYPASNKEGRHRVTAMMLANPDLFLDAGEIPPGIRGATVRFIARDEIGGRPSRGYRKHIRKMKGARE